MLEAVSVELEMRVPGLPAIVLVRLEDVDLRDRTFDIRCPKPSAAPRAVWNGGELVLASTPLLWRRRIPYTVVCGLAGLDALRARAEARGPEHLAAVEVAARMLEDACPGATIVHAMAAASVREDTGEFDLSTLECARAIRALERAAGAADRRARVSAYLRLARAPARTAARARKLAAADASVWERLAAGSLSVREAESILRRGAPGSETAAGTVRGHTAEPPRSPPRSHGTVWYQSRKGRVIVPRLDVGPRDAAPRLRAIARELSDLQRMLLFLASEQEEGRDPPAGGSSRPPGAEPPTP